MHGMTKSVMELHGMLKNAEENIKKTTHVLMVQKGITKKVKGKGKAKVKLMGPKPSGSAPPPPKANMPKLKESESTCFHCNKVGHWKRNCALYKDQGVQFRYLCYRD